MFGRIFGTITTRIVTAAITLLIVLVNSWVLGAEKVGTIALILLAVTLIQLVNNFVAGGAIVYLLPRTRLIQLFLPCCIWALLTSAVGTLALDTFHMIPAGYSWHVLALSVIYSMASANFQILLGQEKIRAFNIITVLQMLALVLTLFFLLFVVRLREVMAYVYGLYASYGLAFVVTMILVIPSLKPADLKGTRQVVREVFRYGSVMQTGNILQFLNYRLGFYFIDFFMGRAPLGIYNVGVQLSESIWLVSRSISMVQYTRISNEKSREYAARLTLTLVKIAFLLSLASLVAVFAVIFLFFPLIFKPEFRPIHIVMVSLALGILVFSVSIVLSPYFSGLGMPKHNTISAGIGLAFTAVFGWLLVPRMGLIGGGIAASLSYLVSTLYQVIVFMKDTGYGIRDFGLKKHEIAAAVKEVRGFLALPGRMTT